MNPIDRRGYIDEPAGFPSFPWVIERCEVHASYCTTNYYRGDRDRLSRAASNLKFPEEKKMESEDFQGSGPLLDPRGRAVFIAPYTLWVLWESVEAAPPKDGAPPFCCSFCLSVPFGCNFFFWSSLSSN